MLCSYCLVTEQLGLGSSVDVHNNSFNDDAFTKTGFSKCKKALKKHKSSLIHHHAMDVVVGKNNL